MSCMCTAPWRSLVLVGGTSARGPAARFECLKFCLGVGHVNRVVTCANERLSARFLLRRVLRAQTFPTSPLMLKSEHFARFGGHKQLHKAFAPQRYWPPTRLATLHVLPFAPALCVCHTAARFSAFWRRPVSGIVASLAEPTVTPAGLQYPNQGCRARAPIEQHSLELTSETSSHGTGLIVVACVIAGDHGLTCLLANKANFTTLSKSFTF